MSQPKYIPITKSRLYRLGRKADLAERLGLSLPDLKKLASDNFYREWVKQEKGKKDRTIEEPRPELANVLSRLHNLLKVVETPPWLMSGKKKISAQDNARIHQNNPHAITVDIASFFQSTRREFAYKAFRDLFKQTNDVASLLADLGTYKGHIPTGTATSQDIAYWAYAQTFERIQKLCQVNGIIMSLWVDDITFSSTKPFPKNWVPSIQAIAKSVELSLKTKKTKKYNPSEHKIITGSAISPDGDIRVKNEKRKEIVDILKGGRVEDLNLKETRSLLGKLTSQRQNEKDFFDGVYSRSRAHLKKLEARKSKKR
jgi:hypothetical protein